MEDTGDTFSNLRWNTNSLHKSHKQWQMFQRKLQGTNLLLNFFLYFFWSLFILAFSCCLHLFWTASYRTVGMITRHSTQGAQGRFIFCWESEQKKVPLSEGDHNVLNFLAKWLCYWLFFSDGVIMSSCFKMFLLHQKMVQQGKAPNNTQNNSEHKTKPLP